MRITSKGQVTIPLDVRKQTGLVPDTEVEIEPRGSTALIKKARKGKSRGERIVERIRGTGRIKMTTDEIMRLTRGED
jgi:bifunctional DNA-binding transcriptional regulator/antitoxin component of YhaV-PrlF toxin-antitoxin module